MNDRRCHAILEEIMKISPALDAWLVRFTVTAAPLFAWVLIGDAIRTFTKDGYLCPLLAQRIVDYGDWRYYHDMPSGLPLQDRLLLSNAADWPCLQPSGLASLRNCLLVLCRLP